MASESTVKTSKPDGATPADPTRDIVNWILAGHSEADIIDAIAKTWPKAKARPLIVAAIEQITKAGEVDQNLIRGFALEATREVYRKAAEIGDHQIALRALKQMVELSR